MRAESVGLWFTGLEALVVHTNWQDLHGSVLVAGTCLVDKSFGRRSGLIASLAPILAWMWYSLRPQSCCSRKSDSGALDETQRMDDMAVGKRTTEDVKYDC